MIIIVRVEGSAQVVTFIFLTFLLNIIPIFRGLYIYTHT